MHCLSRRLRLRQDTSRGINKPHAKLLSQTNLKSPHDVAGLIVLAGRQQLGDQLSLALLRLVALHGCNVPEGPAANIDNFGNHKHWDVLDPP